jgi:hypothetical protein
MAAPDLQYDPQVRDPEPFALEAPMASLELAQEVAPVIPSRFVRRPADAKCYTHLSSMETYPRQTYIHCWWDAHSFSTPPVGLPVRRDDDTNTYHCIGCFCSFECALAYARSRHMSPVLLSQLRGAPLHPALHFGSLALFGGDLDIAEFRKGLSTRDFVAPLVPWSVISQERTRNVVAQPKIVAKRPKKISKLRLLSMKKAE